MDNLVTIRAQQEAQRIRSALRKQRSEDGPVLMVVTPQEVGLVWEELTPVERQRVKLLTSWPWDRPALASTTMAAA